MVAERTYDRTHVSPRNRVTKRAPCEWCDDYKFCLRFDDGASFCRTVGEPDQWTDAFMGGYLHRPEDWRPTPERLEPAPKPRRTHADPDTNHDAYSALLDLAPADPAMLTAAPHHLTREQAARYGQIPADPAARRRLVADVERRIGRERLVSVPGFVEEDGVLKLRASGLVLPVRDREQRIVALDVRRSDPKPDEGKYYKLSSRTDADPDGPSPGTPAHVAYPDGGVTDTRTVNVTEGVKKADAMADATGCVTLSIAGIDCWRPALEHIAAFDPDVVVLALDRDAKPETAERVERVRAQIAAAVAALGVTVRIAAWSPEVAKGVDDLLIAGHTYTLEKYRPVVIDVPPSAAALPPSMVPAVLALLIKETCAAHTLRWRLNRLRDIRKDTILKDGQKLALMAIVDRLPAPHKDDTPTQPVRISLNTLARDVGSPCTPQKNGTERPTKLSTVTKNVGDLVNMGVIPRDEVYESKTVYKKSDQPGKYVQVSRPVPTYHYHNVISLPGERLKREEADELSLRAKAHRERPRCPHCFSDDLTPTGYACNKCGTLSTAKDATEAGQAIVEKEGGVYVHRETAEIVVPGVPIEDIDPLFERPCNRIAVSLDVDEHNDRNAVTGDERPDEPAEPCPTCRKVEYRYRARFNDWTCARCYPAPARKDASA